MKAISNVITWSAAWVVTATTVWAGVSPPPAVESDSGNEGLVLLVLLGAVIFAISKGKAKPVDDGSPTVVDDDAGAGAGKY